ncbi:hypothetical protein DACRYDRAFT_23155 [Dacryopinax primogenitus]|uniref:Uncharacterized protein n=1 Tax=Dacryopinax primogenitus (strain DJM 731) TaxID=1858805 RepID=M5G4P6_DACPD|nr:uncharacterized protein DACRYDRAFT_23155 [Dacryopinax primogenitus]EJU00837.1 hypothetical protein DACRYDRAFT_23155 [Dacryopinax primogenitus]
MAIEPFLGTRTQKLFLSCVLVECTLLIILTALSFGFVQADVADNTQSAYKTLPCYFALFVLAGVFTLYITLDALWHRNIITLVGMLLFTSGLCVFSGIQIREVRIALAYSNCQAEHVATCMDLFNIVERFLIVVPIIIFLALAIYGWCTMRLFGEFGWAVFHTIGADPRIKHMYRFYEVFVCLLKFDYFAVLALTMQLVILDLSTDTVEYYLTIIAIPVSLILLIGCGYSVKKEIWSIMIFSLLLMGAAMAYILYKVTRFWVGPHASTYITTRGTLTFFSIVCVIMLGASFCIGIRCMLFFGRGLKQAQETAPERIKRAKLAHQASDRDAAEEGFVSSSAGKEGVALPLERRLSIE